MSSCGWRLSGRRVVRCARRRRIRTLLSISGCTEVIMDEREAFQLLTLASARDGRSVSQAVARVWAGDLERISLGDAIEAATLHYRESTDWLLPGHVVRNVARARETRLPPRQEITAGECSHVFKGGW